MSRVLRILEYNGKHKDIARTLNEGAVPVIGKRKFGNVSISSNVVKLEDSEFEYNKEHKPKEKEETIKDSSVKTLKELVALPSYKTTSSIGLEFERESGLRECIFHSEIKFCGHNVRLEESKSKKYEYVGVNKMGSIHLRKEWVNIGGSNVN